MQLAGGDANFRAETIFKTVGESGRSIVHNRSRIHFAQEALRRNRVLSDDTLGVMRPLMRNMGHGVVYVFH